MVLFIRPSGKGKTIRIGSCQRMGVAGEQWLTRGVEGDGTALYSTRVVDTHPTHLSKSIQLPIKKNEL